MRRTVSTHWILPAVSLFAAIARTGSAQPLGDGDLCAGTGSECVISTKIIISRPEGIDITHPAGGLPPLTLRIKPGGALLANDVPPIPLTIRAGAIVVEKGGSIGGNIGASKGNTLTLIADSVTILGSVDASSLRVNSTGGDGGEISVTATGACQIGGKVLANGSRSTSIGGAGGDVNFDCATVDVYKGALIEASASGPGAPGGNVALGASVGALNLQKGSTIRAWGSGLDGGLIALSTDSSDPSDSCTLAGKIIADAKTVGTTTGPALGAGGNLDLSCGGDVFIESNALVSLTGGDGGGSVDVFCGHDFTMKSGASIKANATEASGGSVDITTGNNAKISGRIETRAGGLISGNDGGISVTSAGDLVIAKGTAFDVSAGNKGLQAGQITLADGDGSAAPRMTIENGAVLKANGHTAGFGALDIDISGSLCTVGGKIQSDAQLDNGIVIGLECDVVSLESTSVIQATSRAAGGGSLAIDTSGEFSGNPGDCTLAGKIKLKGSTGTNAIGVVVAGRGGNLDTNCGGALTVPERALIDVGAGGPQSVGGQVTLSATQAMHIGGSIRSKSTGGFSTGGRIAVGAPDVFFDATPGAIDVGAETGGTIEASATDGTAGGGVLLVGKTLSAKGTALGGNVVVSGCDVTVGSSGWMRADGSHVASSGGVNEIRARSQLAIGGKLTAVNGLNSIAVNPIMSPAVSGTINPVAFFDHSLTPCP